MELGEQGGRGDATSTQVLPRCSETGTRHDCKPHWPDASSAAVSVRMAETRAQQGPATSRAASCGPGLTRGFIRWDRL